MRTDAEILEGIETKFVRRDEEGDFHFDNDWIAGSGMTFREAVAKDLDDHEECCG